jgi:NAD+ synthase (glutamine-hydrolysing)
MKIALAQLNFHVGNFEFNISKILQTILRAKKEGVDLVVFPELAVCGYPARDFLDYPHFIDSCENGISNIAQVCDDIACIVGGPSRNVEKSGKKLHNSAYFIANKKVEFIQHKSLLPTYDVFDEYRYFEAGKSFEIISFKGKKLALTVCEDIWALDDEHLYSLIPLDKICQNQPDLIINISASPFTYQHTEERKRVLYRNALKYKRPIIYVNLVGAQTELLFDGGSMVFNSSAELIKELSYFNEDYYIIDISTIDQFSGTAIDETLPDKFQIIDRIYQALVMGIKDYFVKLGFTKAIMGLSGGIDSAVVLALAVDALGKGNVNVLLMPSKFSSGHSVKDAIDIADRLGVNYENIPISETFTAYEHTLEPYFKNTSFNVAEENIQARIRGNLLMAFCNKFGYILLNTSNKSELAVGYGTLYGDMCGGLSVIGDVYKTHVYELAHYINKNREIIPSNIITKAPSAELRPNQKDSDSLPEYELLDKVLFQYIEMKKGPDELLNMGFEENIIKKILHMVNSNEYKRFQSPPILRVSPKAFGMGRRMPLEGKYLSI